MDDTIQFVHIFLLKEGYPVWKYLWSQTASYKWITFLFWAIQEIDSDEINIWLYF
jgi:hypothetical protein